MRRQHVRISRSCENLRNHGRNASGSLVSSYGYTSTDASTPDPDPEQARAEEAAAAQRAREEKQNEREAVQIERPMRRRVTEGMVPQAQQGNRSVSAGNSKLPRMRGRNVSRTMPAQEKNERPKSMIAMDHRGMGVGMGVVA